MRRRRDDPTASGGVDFDFDLSAMSAPPSPTSTQIMTKAMTQTVADVGEPGMGSIEFDLSKISLDAGDAGKLEPRLDFERLRRGVMPELDLSSINLDLGGAPAPRAGARGPRTTAGTTCRPSSTSPRPTRRWATRKARARSCAKSSPKATPSRRPRPSGCSRRSAKRAILPFARLRGPAGPRLHSAPIFFEHRRAEPHGSDNRSGRREVMRIALGLEYDGSPFCGWQTQPSGCAVQDALERALAQIADQRVEIAVRRPHRRGRARARPGGAFRYRRAQRPLTAWVRGVNALLPRTVAVTWAREVEPEFHARYQRARPRLHLSAAQPPGAARACTTAHVGWHHHQLDLEPMREAAAHLLGEHDFSAFRAAECQARSPVKELRRARHRAQRRSAGVRVRRRCVPPSHGAQHRRLPGQGRQRQPRARMARGGAGRPRSRAGGADLPANGLYLTAVEYDAAWGLPAHAACRRRHSGVCLGAWLASCA